jgi:hypothetical protein
MNGADEQLEDLLEAAFADSSNGESAGEPGGRGLAAQPSPKRAKTGAPGACVFSPPSVPPRSARVPTKHAVAPPSQRKPPALRTPGSWATSASAVASYGPPACRRMWARAAVALVPAPAAWHCVTSTTASRSPRTRPSACVPRPSSARWRRAAYYWCWISIIRC